MMIWDRIWFRSDHSLCVPMAGRDGQKARHLQDRENERSHQNQNPTD